MKVIFHVEESLRGGGLIQGDPVGRRSLIGEGGIICTPWSRRLPTADPSPLLLLDLAIFLPICKNMSAAPGKPGRPCVASVQCLGPNQQRLRDPLPPSAELLFCCCWFFPRLPPGEERFPNSGMDSEQKVMDSAVTKPPEDALVEERTLPHRRVPSPLAPV